MTQSEYDLLLGILELYVVLFQTVSVLVLWKIVFRTEKEKSAVIAAVLFIVINLATKLPFTIRLIRYIASIVFAEGYCFFRYRKHYEKAVFVLLLFYNFYSLSFLAAYSISQKLQNVMMADLNIMQSDYLYQATLKIAISSVALAMVCTFLMILMMLASAKILRNADRMDWHDVIMLSLPTFAGGILLNITTDLGAVRVGEAVFYLYDTKKEMLWKIPLVAGCIFAGEILLIYFWQNYKELLEEKQKHFVEEQQIKVMKQRLEEAENFYGNVRRIRHEMKNHMTNIKGLAAGEQYEEIAGYIQKIDETMQELEYKYTTGNAVTDVILNDKWHKAEKSGIRFEADFQYTGEIPAFDVGIILNNLLDNAIEACGKIEQKQRFIRITLKRKKQFLLIDVENSFDGILNRRDNKQLPLTTKESNAPDILTEHGIGLRNVSDIAKRYYGGVNIKVREKVFHITVMLQQEEKTI
ncbi:MAG: sensor histidine kinase [Lachnospiraceae bacterium]|nr:sensor histidine kinase [Lachnospiraceae bacterium]